MNVLYAVRLALPLALRFLVVTWHRVKRSKRPFSTRPGASKTYLAVCQLQQLLDPSSCGFYPSSCGISINKHDILLEDENRARDNLLLAFRGLIFGISRRKTIVLPPPTSSFRIQVVIIFHHLPRYRASDRSWVCRHNN